MIVHAQVRRLHIICAVLFLALHLMSAGAARAAETPEEAWRKAIAEQNKSYAETLRAMLKVQDSVYLADGQSAQLVGRVGEPASWRWSTAPDAPGTLSVSFQSGRLSVQQDGRPFDTAQVERGISIDKNVDVAGHSTQVAAGITGWRFFVYNQGSAAAKSFAGVSYFAYDPDFRVIARFQPDSTLPPRVFRTSRGTDKQFYHAGDAVFTLKGKPVTLPFYADANDPKQIKEMTAFFTDALTGNGAYGAGRYVDVAGIAEFPPSTVVIDLNQAYNPNCARSPHFTCPIAVDSIDLPVTAGERDPHAAH
jgi:uncharacterized protein (DUF1684 family)